MNNTEPTWAEIIGSGLSIIVGFICFILLLGLL